MAFATAKDVIVQVPWFGETPRSPAIAGMETFAMDVSRTFMKVASATASDARTLVPPSRGCGPAGSAAGVRAIAPRLAPDRHHRLLGRVLGDDARDALVRLGVRRGEGLRLVGARALDLLQPARGALVRVDVDLHRQADLQRMLMKLTAIERDAHRDSLHDLDPVPARVLLREQRAGAARAGAEAGHAAVEFDRASISIGAQGHRLPGTQVRELVFLEVRIHPDVVERHDRHEDVAGADALPQLHRAPGHESGNGRRSEEHTS